MNDIKAPIDRALAAGNRPNPRRAPIRPDTRHVQVPVDHQPGAILGEGPSAQTARAAMAGIHDSWVNIQSAAADESVDLPRLAAAAQKAMERALTKADKAAVTITTHMAAVDREITRAVEPRIDSTLAAEIREYWRDRNSPSELTKAVGRDVRTAGAVLTAPGYLSGLDAKGGEVVRTAAVNAFAAEHQAALEEAGAALSKITTAANRMTDVVGPKIAVWRQEPNPALKALEGGGDGDE